MNISLICNGTRSNLSSVLRKGQGIVLDRSVFSDCVFANVGRKQGFISAEGILRVLVLCCVQYPDRIFQHELFVFLYTFVA